MRQAGLLLTFISLLYLPGGFDPNRYYWNAVFGVVTRMAIGLYWLWLVYFRGETGSFLQFGFLDCGYAVFNGVLLVLFFSESDSVAKAVPLQDNKNPQ